MASKANPGQMRTIIRILRPSDAPDAAGYANPGYVNIYPDNRAIHCKWVSAFGAEAMQAGSLGIKDMATLTLRFDPRVTPECIITRGDGEAARTYEIISQPNDVADAHRWMELRVKRRVATL